MNWGKKIELTFDRPVHYVTRDELPKWAIKNTRGEMIYPTSIYRGETDHVVYLDFDNFNNLILPATLECFGCVRMGSQDLPFLPFSVSFYPQNLYPIPDGREHLGVSSVSILGELVEYIPPAPLEAHSDTGLLSITAVAISGIISDIELSNYDPTSERLKVSVSVTGQYCDINGIPV